MGKKRHDDLIIQFIKKSQNMQAQIENVDHCRNEIQHKDNRQRNSPTEDDINFLSKH
jgi:hypothetical protein